MTEINLPRCPKCGKISWVEEWYGLVYQPITPSENRIYFEQKDEPKVDRQSVGCWGEDRSIYCRSCLLRATPALEKAIRSFIKES